MAKFTSKNVEFQDHQKAIFGTDDDSSIYWNGDNNELTITTVVSGVTPTEPGHLTPRFYNDETYVPQDGSRGFKSTVSGVYPTEDYHLATREFLLDVLLGTTDSGVEIPQIGNILFGSEFYYELDEAVSSTNSTSYQNKLSLTVSGVPEGNYRLGTHFEWKISKNNIDFYFRISYDNASTVLDEIWRPTFNDVNIYNPETNFYYLETLTSGTHTFDLDYHSESTGSTGYIRNARLEFWRVS